MCNLPYWFEVKNCAKCGKDSKFGLGLFKRDGQYICYHCWMGWTQKPVSEPNIEQSLLQGIKDFHEPSESFESMVKRELEEQKPRVNIPKCNVCGYYMIELHDGFEEGNWQCPKCHKLGGKEE